MSNWDEAAGKTKDVAGEATGDESLEREGEVQGFVGEAKDKAGDAWNEAKDKASDVSDEVRDRT